MKNSIKNYFQFSQNEKRGVLILLLLIFAGLLFPTIYGKFQKDQIVDYSEFEEQIDNFLSFKSENTNTPKVNKAILFPFDPNTLDKSGFHELGLPEKVTNTIIKYRNKGGHFNEPSDLLSIYGLSQKDYKRIVPYVNIIISNKSTDKESKKLYVTQSSNYKKYEVNDSTQQLAIQIELNSADSIQLISVSGIGPVFANRIINYRNYLGGYSKIDQLLEVYGFSNEMFANLESKFIVDSSLVRFINLNQTSFKELNKHPYISYKQTKSIFKYKQLMGEYTELSELLTNNLIDSITYQKVKPYLRLN